MPEMAATEVSAVPAQVAPALSATKATVSTAKAAMSAANTSVSAATPISSERGGRHQQYAGNHGRKSEFGYH
jgi:hypothetical protein